jgi:hypothetical protein
VPSERVRRMEIKANEAVDVYRDLYVDPWRHCSCLNSNSHGPDTTKAVSPQFTSGTSIRKASLAVCY